MNTPLPAKRLHQETDAVLDRLEEGECFAVVRNGRRIGRLVPEKQAPATWAKVLSPVLADLAEVRTNRRQPNPVLEERSRRRR